MKFYVLGALGVGDGSERITTTRGLTSTVFAMLLLHFNEPVHPRTMITSLWPDSQPVSASANLRQYISRVRKLLSGFSERDAARLRLVDGGYCLTVHRHELDLTSFEDLVEAGKRGYDDGDLKLAHRCLEEALNLWRGEICQGTALGPAFEIFTRYWEERRLEASRLLLQTRLRFGQYNRAIADIQPMVARDPFREDLVAALMTALYLAHRRAEALQVFRVARQRFVSELGIEPTAHLQRLHQLILKDEGMPSGFEPRLPVAGAGVRAAAV